MENSKHNLELYHQLFSRDHDRLKADLMARLPQVTYTDRRSAIAFPVFHPRLVHTLKRGLAAAVVFALVVSAFFMYTNNRPATTNAWADPIQLIKNVNTVHFVFSTPGDTGSPASVEVWWQSNGFYRMQYSSGLTCSFDGSSSYIQSPDGQLRVLHYDGPGPQTFILSVLGQIGNQDQRFSAMPGMTEKDNQVSSREITYKGQDCLQISSQNDNFLYQYIVDRDIPMIYQVTMCRANDTENPIALAEVIDIDSQMEKTWFVIPDNKPIE